MFEVDPKGLANLLRDRGLHRMIEELISNSMDEKEVTKISVSLGSTGAAGVCRFTVEDDSPTGFRKLSDAYTLFADSYKKSDPGQRGRFNFGEKWVIACCLWAEISTTSGTIIFEHGRRRQDADLKRKNGTLFTAEIKADASEIPAAVVRLRHIIPDHGITLIINDEPIFHRTPVVLFDTTLPTHAERLDGQLIRTDRRTNVACYQIRPGEQSTVYEMGIPIVTLDENAGDPFHYDVRQKVPLSLNRDNVPPRFLKKLRTAAVDHTYLLMSKEQAGGRAVTEALETAKPEAVKAVMEKRYGEKRAIYDPSDLEANNRLAGEGYTIIPGGSFDKAVWQNVKESGAAVASGTVRPTAKPYYNGQGGVPVKFLDPDRMTAGMQRMEYYIRLLACEVCGQPDLTITWINDFNCHFSMCCAPGKLDINVAKLGYAWFEAPPATRWEVDDLLLDEFGHFRETNHLCDRYFHALREFGAKIGVLKLTRPELFTNFR